jgi:hypothetical protein
LPHSTTQIGEAVQRQLANEAGTGQKAGSVRAGVAGGRRRRLLRPNRSRLEQGSERCRSHPVDFRHLPPPPRPVPCTSGRFTDGSRSLVTRARPPLL